MGAVNHSGAGPLNVKVTVKVLHTNEYLISKLYGIYAQSACAVIRQVV